MVKKRLSDPKVQYLMVLFSNAGVMIMGFVTNIIFTHTMQTEEYGFYKAFVNGLNMLTTMTSLGISLTLSREFAICESEDEKKRFTGASYIINLAISITTFVLLIMLSAITNLFNYSVPDYLLLSAAFLWTMLFNRFYLLRFQGENSMFYYSILTLVPQCLLTVIYIVFYILNTALSSFIAISCYLLCNIFVIFVFGLIDLPKFGESKKYIRITLSKNKNYGFQLYIGSLSSVASVQILNLLVASISGLNEYALFTMGMSLASPISQIPSTMGTISFKNNVNLNKISSKQILVTFTITAVCFLTYALFLKYLFCLIMGEKYLDSISYAIIMMIYYALLGLGDFFNRFISAKGYGKKIRNSSFVVGISLIVSAAIFVPLFAIRGVILAEIISGAVYLLFMISEYHKIVKFTDLNNC